MFRLVKLAAYMLLGYALYELILGISEGESARGSAGGGGQRGAGQGQKEGSNEGQPQRKQGGQQKRQGGQGGGAQGSRGADRGTSAAGQVISGPGKGQPVAVADTGGAGHTERVGRGVVSR